MKHVILLGGSGYIGTHLCEAWLRKDSEVQIISVSRNGRPKKLSPYLADNERIQWVGTNVFDVNSYIGRLPERADAIVDLIGTATANSEQEFEKLNVEPVHIMIELMERLHIPRGCYISGLMGMPFKNKPFLASKHKGEAVAMASQKQIGIIRPSLVYGDRPEAAFMVPFVKAMGLLRKELKPTKVDQLANQIIQVCSN